MPAEPHHTLPLFDDAGLRTDGSSTERASRTQPVRQGGRVVTAACPHCRNEAVTIHRGGEHLLWVNHDVVTVRGTRSPCRASGTALCDHPPRDLRQPGMPEAPLCPHRNAYLTNKDTP